MKCYENLAIRRSSIALQKTRLKRDQRWALEGAERIGINQGSILAMVMFSPAKTSVSTAGYCREEERRMLSEAFVVFISMCC
jgi:hypothetical protein